MSEREPGGNLESYASRRERQERAPQNLREEIERLYLEAPTELAREILEKMLAMVDAKERAKKLASYIVTADPRDISTYYPEKKLGILLACDTRSPKTYRIGNDVIEVGDPLIQLHIPPRLVPANQHNPVLRDLSESLQLVSDYITFHGLSPKYVTACTYEPIIRLAERRYGLSAVRVHIPAEWSERVERVFHRYIDPDREPVVGFLYATTQQFQQRFPPRS